ncbi:NUDIX hydrolase [Candidatus Saccharibacteria bacterium]|nr:NUDIX hydrolase [Candidatus Saccharibacteria bacterium]
MDWTLFEKGVFLVNLLGIIYNPNTKMILIGRRVNDPNLKDLSWVFPGGRPDYKNDLEFNVAHEIKENTGLDVGVKNIVFSKTYPEKREFLSIYYYCELESIDAKEQPIGNLKEFKWIKPTDVTEYFTTSIHPKVLEYLKTLE